MEKTIEMFCSFCGKPQQETKKIIASPMGNCFICDDCVAICQNMLKEDKVLSKLEDIELLSPAEIKKALDNYIIGQDEAKKFLAVAVYNHYKKMNYNNVGKKEKEEIELDKSNILMIGPTGSGKTLLAKTLAGILKVPFACADATTLTEAGYVGDDVENVLLKLIQAADYDIKKAERGIIYIDEIDKVARKGENKSITRDVSGEGVQQALLKIIESTVAGVPPQGGRKHPQQELLYINTANILFICGGAFVGLDKIIEKRMAGSSLGFNAIIRQKDEIKVDEAYKNIQPEDLIKFGLIPEFVGRMPIVVGLHDLNEKSLIQILTTPQNAITKQYKKLFNIDGVELKFTDDAIVAIAKKALKLKTGARGLRTILENVLNEVMFMAPSDKSIKTVEINGAVIDNIEEPKVIRLTSVDGIETKKSKTNNKKETA